MAKRNRAAKRRQPARRVRAHGGQRVVNGLDGLLRSEVRASLHELLLEVVREEVASCLELLPEAKA
jgi:hypothetical protein